MTALDTALDIISDEIADFVDLTEVQSRARAELEALRKVAEAARRFVDKHNWNGFLMPDLIDSVIELDSITKG